MDGVNLSNVFGRGVGEYGQSYPMFLDGVLVDGINLSNVFGWSVGGSNQPIQCFWIGCGWMESTYPMFLDRGVGGWGQSKPMIF